MLLPVRSACQWRGAALIQCLLVRNLVQKKQAAEDPTDGSVSSVTVPVSASARSSSLRHEAGLGLTESGGGARWEATWCGSAHHRPGY